MKRGLLVGVGTVTVVSVVLAAAVQGTEAKLKKGSVVGQVSVGGLLLPDAQKKLRVWWESERTKKLTLVVKDKNIPQTFTSNDLGFTIDDVASIAQVPLDGLIGQVMSSDEKQIYPVLFKRTTDFKKLKDVVKGFLGTPAPAKVKFVSGKIQRLPEQPTYDVDEAQFIKEYEKGILDDGVINVPLKEGPKKITDEVLAQISDVVTTFKTNFSSGNRPRSSNIRLAASKIDGLVLLPGEKFSFNGTVGRRTKEGGFKEAGVYINGRHDTGVGGGICQVSTTLYNACLFANLKIVQRTNHSLPVPYVPLGRDATVNYGAQDLEVENNMTTPVVIASTYEPGTLTFRILGKKDPALEVKITSTKVRYGGGGSTVREYDSSLPAGVTRVKEGGGTSKSVSTFRNVYKNGVKVATEPLGQSYYIGAPRVIIVGTRQVARPTIPPPAAGSATVTPPPTGGN